MGKFKSLIFASIAVILAANTVFAQTDDELNKRREEVKEKVYRELSLSKEQQDKLEANRKIHRERLSQIMSSIKEKQESLKVELKKPAVSQESIEPIINEIKSLQAQLIDLRVEGILEVKAALTPEQFEKLQQMGQKRQENRKKRIEGWRERMKENKNFTD